jgi:hypothetical protein
MTRVKDLTAPGPSTAILVGHCKPKGSLQPPGNKGLPEKTFTYRYTVRLKVAQCVLTHDIFWGRLWPEGKISSFYPFLCLKQS